MEYLDSSVRASGNALGSRLAQEVATTHEHLRIKTGYFALNGLAGLKASIDHLVQNDKPITIALGANEQTTIKADVDALHALLGCPRPKAKLCVVSCSGGLFHPKVIHLTRTDGSQFAYVGSANVTPSGLNGANIEAGVLLDSRAGDPAAVLNEIAASIDDLFAGTKDGVTMIAGPATTQQLVSDGVLGLSKPAPSPSDQSSSSGGASATKRMKLKPLVTLPALTAQPQSAPAGSNTTQSSVPPPVVTLSAVKDILIAEIGGGPRWKQANFPLAIMESYFGVNPTGGPIITLVPVAANGSASPPVPTQVVSVPSQNYRMELTSVAGLAYPSNGRPIAVFRKTGAATFRYRVLLPGDPGHGALAGALAQRYTGPKHHLQRVSADAATLQAIWAACPV